MQAIAGQGETGLEQLSRLLRSAAEPLPHPSDIEGFGAHFDQFADARVLVLDEPTWGSSEFYRARGAISRRMIERHGARIIAVDTDWYDATRIDAYVRLRRPQPIMAGTPRRFPDWIWRNRESLEFAEWLRDHNAGRAPQDRVAVVGLDLFALHASINTMIAYLAAIDPVAAQAARERCGDAVRAVEAAGCRGPNARHEPAVIARLCAALAKRIGALGADGTSVASAARRFYRALWRGAAPGYSLHGQIMFVMLQSLLAAGGRDAKLIAWTHSTGRARSGPSGSSAPERGNAGFGELCRAAHGDALVVIGFGTDRGLVAAASEWGGTMGVKPIPPALGGSWEHVFHHAGFARSLTEWRSPSRRALGEILRCSLGQRAIGVVYRPDRGPPAPLLEAGLRDHCDAYVWFDETSPITPLAPQDPAGRSAQWPFGA